MKTYKIILELIGLAGLYCTEFEVKARNEESARKKGMLVVGDRSFMSIRVTEVKGIL